MAPRVLRATFRSARRTPARKGRCPRTPPQRAPYPAPALGHRTADTVATPGMFQPKRITISKHRPALREPGRNRPDCTHIPTGIQPRSAPPASSTRTAARVSRGLLRSTRPTLARKGRCPCRPRPPGPAFRPAIQHLRSHDAGHAPAGSASQARPSTGISGVRSGTDPDPIRKCNSPSGRVLPFAPPSTRTTPLAPGGALRSARPRGTQKKAAPKDRPISHPAIAGAIRSRCDTVRCR